MEPFSIETNLSYREPIEKTKADLLSAQEEYRDLQRHLHGLLDRQRSLQAKV
jgi:hypothetical protein